MLTNPDNPEHWILLARERLEKADALQAQFGSSFTGVELLQEAVERFLKGYLVGKGWSLLRTHNLVELVAEASDHDRRFREFFDLAASLTQQFWQQHYPGGDLSEVGHDYAELREQSSKLIRIITASVEGS